MMVSAIELTLNTMHATYTKSQVNLRERHSFNKAKVASIAPKVPIV